MSRLDVSRDAKALGPDMDHHFGKHISTTRGKKHSSKPRSSACPRPIRPAAVASVAKCALSSPVVPIEGPSQPKTAEISHPRVKTPKIHHPPSTIHLIIRHHSRPQSHQQPVDSLTGTTALDRGKVAKRKGPGLRTLAFLLAPSNNSSIHPSSLTMAEAHAHAANPQNLFITVEFS